MGSKTRQTVRERLLKADLTLDGMTTDDGILLPEQAKQFLMTAIVEPAFMSRATVAALRSPTSVAYRLGFTSRVLRPGYSGVALSEADRSKPDFENWKHAAKLFKAQIDLPDEVLEDQVEGAQFQTTIRNAVAVAVGRDMEDVVLNGDTASADPTLAVFDGIRKQANVNVYNWGGLPADKDLFNGMLRTMPLRHRSVKARPTTAFFVASDAELKYRSTLENRMTATGDRALAAEGAGAPRMNYSSVPIVEIPLLPDNVGGPNLSDALYMDAKNVEVGIWRRIRFEVGRDIRAGIVFIVVSMRFDAIFIDASAVVKGTLVGTV